MTEIEVSWELMKTLLPPEVIQDIEEFSAGRMVWDDDGAPVGRAVFRPSQESLYRRG